MAESAPQPKHLALDTDWASAVGMGFLFAFLLLVLAISARRMIYGPWTLDPITWQTWLLIGMCAWFFFAARQGPYRKPIRLISILLAVGPTSRILLRASHATPAMQLTNDAFVRVINCMLYFGGCVFVLWWFKSKVRYV